MGPPSSLKKCYISEDGSRAVNELNHLKSVSTYIRSDSVSPPHTDGQIHLKREVWQE